MMVEGRASSGLDSEMTVEQRWRRPLSVILLFYLCSYFIQMICGGNYGGAGRALRCVANRWPDEFGEERFFEFDWGDESVLDRRVRSRPDESVLVGRKLYSTDV